MEKVPLPKLDAVAGTLRFSSSEDFRAHHDAYMADGYILVASEPRFRWGQRHRLSIFVCDEFQLAVGVTVGDDWEGRLILLLEDELSR